MGMTYTYDTGQITRDFHLLKPDGKSCIYSNLPHGVHCLGCKYYNGKYSGFNQYEREWKSFIRCKLPDISDHESARWAVHQIYEDFENEALGALCN